MHAGATRHVPITDWYANRPYVRVGTRGLLVPAADLSKYQPGWVYLGLVWLPTYHQNAA